MGNLYSVGTLVGRIGVRVGCATLWRNLDLTFDLALVSQTFKILSRLCLRNCNLKEVNACQRYLLGGVGCAILLCDIALTLL